ncbi:hypothetical protein J0A67_03760 [Algoriphagus aestuariicola]|uniref:DUF5777 domain-containing protein n=1 Tax=Algoriphagus aestuariicola TaxID=1852016 RepID=A0ABS3BKZ7_9BACT|nr:DUF5777 family beta-barrel protein [Algoriphagus aestuariicola]MBN7799960.1 hypothetical protein [Algoriphagus aestuariicola]
MKPKFLICFGLLLCLCAGKSQAQEEVEKEATSAETVTIFHAPRHINLLTVEPLLKKTMHFALMHTFGTLDGGIENLFGLDNGANILIGFEYGLGDRVSIGLTRTSQDKVYQLFGRYHLLQQKSDESIPLSLSFAGGAGVISGDYSYLPTEEQPEFSDRMVYSGQVMIARKFGEKISLALTPMFSYFTNPLEIYQIEGTQNFYLALGMSGAWHVTESSSLTLQWIPNLNSDIKNNFGIGWDIKAGQHVFQMYFVTSSSLNEPYLLAGFNGVPGEEFRLGFNVNRLFFLGKDW